MKFGPDKMLYVGTGLFLIIMYAQNIEYLLEKYGESTLLEVFLKTTHESYVYALGMRDPQGLSWDSEEQCMLRDCLTINIIHAGANYGQVQDIADQIRALLHKLG